MVALGLLSTLQLELPGVPGASNVVLTERSSSKSQTCLTRRDILSNTMEQSAQAMVRLVTEVVLTAEKRLTLYARLGVG